MNPTATNAVVTRSAAVDKHRMTAKLALFNADGTPYGLVNQVVTTATAIATAAKTTTAPEPPAHSLVPIKFTNGNSAASPTVAFNGGAARNVLLGGTAPGAGEVTLAANGVAMFYFDGTALHQLGVYS
jgi:hypothetical protein